MIEELCSGHHICSQKPLKPIAIICPWQVSWPMKNSQSCLFTCLLLNVPIENILFIWRRHRCCCKVRPKLGTYDLWEGRGWGHYRATPGVTIGVGVCGSIRRTDPNLVAYSYLDPTLDVQSRSFPTYGIVHLFLLHFHL